MQTVTGLSHLATTASRNRAAIGFGIDCGIFLHLL